ncbi:MAG TPA: NAD(P)-dependent oxidoreductase [Tepidisphaeraceae bacterium]|jgi:phosphoglycerate dehydrogenase-like enzyme|nr:NAD(P)-dependent oxidoreductase [Tepidisphaeraceae bacterium]
MNNEKPVVIVTEGGDPEPLAWMAERVRMVQAAAGEPEFEKWIGEAEGLSVRTYTRVDQALLDRAPKLRVVGRGGVGIENIDVMACRRRGVEVVYTPDANTLAVGDFVFGYVAQLLRPWNFFSAQAYPPAEFKRIRNTVRGRQFNELTIGIIGMGRVGKRVGHIAANGYGMRVMYNDLLDIQPESLGFKAERVEKAELYRQADIVTLHVTMVPGNQNLIGREQLAMMKPDAILINTSRGEVVNAAALAEAIRGKRLYGAALDVYHPEPPPADFPLLGVENVLLTPHLAARTDTAQKNMSWVVKDIVGVLEGQKPKYPAP